MAQPPPASHPINARFLAYVEQQYAPAPFERSILNKGGPKGDHWLLPLLKVNSRLSRYIRLKQVARRGIPLYATLLQANTLLFQPGNTTLPCLVMFSFDPAVNADQNFMGTLAQRVFSLKGTRPTDEDSRYVAGLTTNELAMKYRRRKLPRSFTNGPIVWVADLYVERHCLQMGYVTERVLPCLAEPGDKGALELLPWWVAAEQDAPRY